MAPGFVLLLAVQDLGRLDWRGSAFGSVLLFGRAVAACPPYLLAAALFCFLGVGGLVVSVFGWRGWRDSVPVRSVCDPGSVRHARE